MDSNDDLLASLRLEISELKAARRTTVTGTQFLVLILFGPVTLAFVALGVLIVWKTLAKPAEVAPHLDIVLVAFAVFSGPVVSGISQVMASMSDELKAGRAKGNNED